MICQVQRWKNLDRWVPGGDTDWEFIHTLVPLDDLLTQRTEQTKGTGHLWDANLLISLDPDFNSSSTGAQADTP
jgi:hypothetical protein